MLLVEDAAALFVLLGVYLAPSEALPQDLLSRLKVPETRLETP